MSFQIDISGLVQGVGFRPFVYRLATQYKLKGYVINNSHGVKIIISCLKKDLELFIERLKRSAPPLSKIEAIKITKLEKRENFRSFIIAKSDSALTFSA